MRVDMNIPVIGLALLSAAVLQDLIPVIPEFPVKPLFMTAVALYVMLTRPIWIALTTLIWAGGLTDALGGLPTLCTSGFLLLAFGATRLMQRVFLEPSVLYGMLLTAGISMLQVIWIVMWSRAVKPFFAWNMLITLGYALLVGIVVGLIVFIGCRFIDRIAGIVRPSKEDHGILWAETNR